MLQLKVPYKPFLVIVNYSIVWKEDPENSKTWRAPRAKRARPALHAAQSGRAAQPNLGNFLEFFFSPLG